MKPKKQLDISNMEPLVTIVTPSFNQGEFLKTTIESVITQSYKRIEYMIFDGGSSDNSINIIKKYEKHLTYWESCPDKGQAHAINKGWKRANGQIFAWLNSDDALMPNAVENIVHEFLSNPDVGMVYGDWSFVDENNTVLIRRKGNPTSYRKLLWGGQIKYLAQPASFFKAECVKKINYLNEALQLAMDYDLILKISKTEKTIYVAKELALFRLHSSAKTAVQAKKHWKETLSVQAGHNKLLLAWSLVRYVLFRMLNSLPISYQMVFRRLRKSENDFPRFHAVIKNQD
jgi:glycosyltransferase involved in cell wall biosynthesis